MSLPLLPLISLVSNVAPEIVGLFAGDKAEKNAEKIAGIVQQVTGTGTIDTAKTALENPEVATELRLALLSHELRLREAAFADVQARHAQTQRTIRAGDAANDRFVRWTRPGQSWLCLIFAGVYVFTADSVDGFILGTLLTLPGAYFGLREFGKRTDARTDLELAKI